ncbi:MAG: hypothetical protein FIA99_08680 [Ruminiclostridium sp.]|nr:hypothetical protein [Ruminiclostridium sp.]
MRQQDIFTSDVQIKTMQVSIKAMVIGNKQVTLSTFKQFLREEIIDTKGNLKGIPWGFVSHNGKNIVWQKDDKIYVSISNNEYRDYMHNVHSSINYGLVGYFIREVLVNKPESFNQEDKKLWNEHAYREVQYKTFTISISEKAIGLITRNWIEDEKSHYLQTDIERLLKDYTPRFSIERYIESIEPFRKYEANFKKSIEQLDKLDQLFIAV